MRYGIAIWNFMEPGGSLADLVAEFADAGFDAVSFSTGQFGRVTAGEWQDVAGVVQERGLTTTIHGSFTVEFDQLAAVASTLGESVHAITFDAAMLSDSRGKLYDWPRMGRVLGNVADRTSARFGVEDCPLDSLSLDYYRDAIPWAVKQHPRYGMLIDLGHLNLRWRGEPYYQALTPQENIARTPLPIHEVHVHDNDGKGDLHGPIGLGNAPFREMAEGLHAVDFDGVSTIEIAPTFHGSTPAEEKPKAKESLELWRQIWEETGG